MMMMISRVYFYVAIAVAVAAAVIDEVVFMDDRCHYFICCLRLSKNSFRFLTKGQHGRPSRDPVESFSDNHNTPKSQRGRSVWFEHPSFYS
jgi:hypothetical protein